MGIMVYSLLWVMQDLYHQQYATEIWKLLVQNIRTYQFRGSCSVILNPPLAYEFYVHLSSECCFFLSPYQVVCVSGMFPYLYLLALFYISIICIISTTSNIYHRTYHHCCWNYCGHSSCSSCILVVFGVIAIGVVAGIIFLLNLVPTLKELLRGFPAHAAAEDSGICFL